MGSDCCQDDTLAIGSCVQSVHQQQQKMARYGEATGIAGHIILLVVGSRGLIPPHYAEPHDCEL